uniref:Cytochrome P450, family 4, subfamily f, polypeptide 18 n=1 Tax=Jaculus jaculus TaxID=51337 RepID=A0A8C5L4N1_JACJA
MLQLNLSWLGWGPVVASPWLVLLLVRTSGLQARILTQIYSFYKNSRCLGCFPQPPKWNQLMGHLGCSEEGLLYIQGLVRTFGDVCCWKVGPWHTVTHIFHPTPSAVASKDMVFYSFLKPCLGDGLLLSAGDKWSCHCHMLTPTFHFNILKPYVKIFNDSTNIMHAKWQHLISQGNACLDTFDHISFMTLDSLQKCIFSFDSNCQEKPSEYISAILELSALVSKRYQRLLLYMDLLYRLTTDGIHFCKACRLVHDFTDGTIQERCHTLPSQGVDEFLQAKAKSKTLYFIDVLLLTKDEDGKQLSDEDIRAEASTFMIGGHDTIASGLSWVLYNLARHSEYQEHCLQESGKFHCQHSSPSDGACNFGTHHNPAVWPDLKVSPVGLYPFRFDPENTKDRSPLAFIPFSAGPRNCLGQTFAVSEMKVALALTLLHFCVLRDDKEPRPQPEQILRAEGGLLLRLEPLGTG